MLPEKFDFDECYLKLSEMPLGEAAALHKSMAPDFDDEELERVAGSLNDVLVKCKSQNRYAVCAMVHMTLSLMAAAHGMAFDEAVKREREETFN